MKFLVVDALSAGKGYRQFTRDVIGCGPRLLAGIIERKFQETARIALVESITNKDISESDFLIISAMSMDLIAVKNIVDRWRGIKEFAPVVIGGPIASVPRQILSQIPADIAIIGEGEKILVKLFEKNFYNLPFDPDYEILQGIKGLAFRMDEKIIVNAPRAPLTKEEFNTFRPSIDAIRNYPNFTAARVFVECVRGCSNFNRPNIRLSNPESIPPGCGFCSVPSTFGPPKSRTIENLIWEISELIKQGVRRIVLSAPDFLDFHREDLVHPAPLTDPCNPSPNLKAINKLLKDIHKVPEVQMRQVYIFIENVKACLISDKVASLIAKYLPGAILSMGCESGSEAQLQAIGKPTTPEVIEKAARILKKHDLGLNAYFIHGLPGETRQSIKSTKKLMNVLYQIGLNKITYYKFSPLPKTTFQDSVPLSSLEAKNLSKHVIEINRALKKDFLQKIVEVVIMEAHEKNPTIGMGRILSGGPTVLVPNAGALIGQSIQVRITAVLSDRLVKGKII